MRLRLENYLYDEYSNIYLEHICQNSFEGYFIPHTSNKRDMLITTSSNGGDNAVSCPPKTTNVVK